MKPLPSFVVWDQNRLQVQVWDYHGLNPVRHWVQLKTSSSLETTEASFSFHHISLLACMCVKKCTQPKIKTRVYKEESGSCILGDRYWRIPCMWAAGTSLQSSRALWLSETCQLEIPRQRNFPAQSPTCGRPPTPAERKDGARVRSVSNTSDNWVWSYLPVQYRLQSSCSQRGQRRHCCLLGASSWLDRWDFQVLALALPPDSPL